MLDFDSLEDLWRDDPSTFGNKSRCADEADALGLVPQSFKESGWVDRFWNEVTEKLFKSRTSDAPQRAVYVRTEQGEFWKPEEMCGFDEIARYVGREIDEQVDALLDVRDQWDRRVRARFGRPLPRFQPTRRRDPGLDYEDDWAAD